MSKENRRDKRVPLFGTVITLKTGQLKFDALVADISREGISIYTLRKIREGRDIWVNSKAFGYVPHNANVKWCTEVAQGVYKTGLALNRY